MSSQNTRKLVRLALLSGIALLLMAVVRFPLIPAAPFLEYTPSDVPMMVACFLYGPWWGLGAIAVTCVIQGLTFSSSSGIIGIVMNILTTSAYCLTASAVYRSGKTDRRMFLGLGCGSLAMIAVAIPLNLLLTPIFMGVARNVVAAMIVPVLLPFNLLRVAINSVVTALVFRVTGPILVKGIPS